MPRVRPVLPDEQRSHRDIPGTDEIGMEGILTDLADKQEALVGAVVISGMPAYRAGEATVVGIHLDRHTPDTQGLVSDHAVQFGKGPFGVGGIGLPLLLTRLLASFPPGSFVNVRQVFQPDQAVGVPGHDACGNDMIGVLLQPSLPSADDNESPRCRTGAFLLKTLPQSRVVVGFGDDAPARMETRLSPSIAGDRQVAHAHVHPDDTRLHRRQRVGHLDGKRNQQVELLLGLVIPEFRRPDGRAVLYQGCMLAIAGVADNHTSRKRQDTHLGIWLEAIVPVEVVGERGRDVLGSPIQPFVAFLGEARLAQSRVLFHLRPEALVGGSHLPGILQAICAGRR